MLLITHDLAIVAQMAHRVALMYAGQVVEVAEAKEFFDAPAASVRASTCSRRCPTPAKRGRRLASIPGTVPAAQPDVRRVPLRRPLRQRDGPLPRARRRSSLRSGRATACAASCTRASSAEPKPCSPRLRPGSGAAGRSQPSATRSSMSRDYRVWFPIRKGLLKRTVGYVKAVDGVSLRHPGRAHAGAGRRIRQRQDHRRQGGAAAPAQHRADRRVARCSRASRSTSCTARRCARRRRAAQIVFQDPFASLNPRMRVNEILEEGVASLCPDVRAAAAHRARRDAARAGRPAARRADPLSARVLGRPAPAARDRARAGGRAEADRRRRADLARSTSRCRRRSSTC